MRMYLISSCNDTNQFRVYFVRDTHLSYLFRNKCIYIVSLCIVIRIYLCIYSLINTHVSYGVRNKCVCILSICVTIRICICISSVIATHLSYRFRNMRMYLINSCNDTNLFLYLFRNRYAYILFISCLQMHNFCTHVSIFCPLTNNRNKRIFVHISREYGNSR
jgi:hypothetical protein